MKNLIRKAALFAVAAVVSVSASAQAGQMAAGANLAVGMGDEVTNFGIGAKFQYGITDNIRGEGAFTYFLEKDYVSMWDFSVNGHYLFPVAEGITVYPLAGLGMTGITVDVSDALGGWGELVEAAGGSTSESKSYFGVNVGGGAEYQLTETLSAGAELKYNIRGDWNRLILQFGVTYKF
ncbi:MAG: porin family protein [Prevotella sp.]|jgi:outer membrane protein X|nr:porin family protein [Prevotella sp.]